MNKTDKSQIFDALKPILARYSESLSIIVDNGESYHLETQHAMKNKKNLFFGAVHIKKNYVSYHLMPVYINPELLTSISSTLIKRMQGKSCFNFKRIDSEFIDELSSLTESGYRYYVEQGYIL